MKIFVTALGKMYGEGGGSAKVSCTMANEFVKHGHDVTLIFADGRDGKIFYKVDSRVHCCDLCKFNGERIKYPIKLKIIREFYRLFGSHLQTQKVNFDYRKEYLSKNLKILYESIKPDVVISYSLSTSDIYISKLHIDTPIVTMCHGDPAYYFKDTPKDVLDVFNTSSVTQVLLPSYVEHITKYMPHAKIVVIGNAVPNYRQQADLSVVKQTYKIIFVGALIKRIKQPHIIIEAFAKLADKYPNWIVELWGPEERKSYRMELELRIKKYGLQNRIFIMGPTLDVPVVLQEADIFAFPSAFEGFGLALAEGMSMGLPGIGYKSCSGVNELIKDGYNGFLVGEGVEPFAQAMEKLMKDRNLRIVMGQHARESVKKYSYERVWNQWEAMLKGVVKGGV